MNILIIGNGITGVTTALEIRRRDPEAAITLISGEAEEFFSRPALMYIFMGQMKLKDTQPYRTRRKFWQKQNIERIKAWVDGVDYEKRRVHLADGRALEWDKLVLATGSAPNMFGWPGQDLPGVHTFYDLSDLAGLEESARLVRRQKQKRAVVVGGGLIGIELVEMLLSRKFAVTYLVREKNYWDIALGPEESEIVHDALREHEVDLRLETEVAEILPGPDGRVGQVVTNRGDSIECEVVGFGVGVRPRLELAREAKSQNRPETGRGILVNEKLETTVPGVWAGGDCAELPPLSAGGRGRVEQIWYTGQMQGRVIAANILGDDQKYDRGVWFNSAKFFDIDFHTYGLVNHKLPGEDNYFWRWPGKPKSLRIVYIPDENNPAGNRVVGFNLLGIRFRHRVCETWIRENRSLDFVLENITQAAFDQEFHASFQKEMPVP